MEAKSASRRARTAQGSDKIEKTLKKRLKVPKSGLSALKFSFRAFEGRVLRIGLEREVQSANA
jgi:hypothetical protein